MTIGQLLRGRIIHPRTGDLVDADGHIWRAIASDGAGPPIYVPADSDDAAIDFAQRRAEKFSASEAAS